MGIPEGQARELADWIQSQPRKGKIDHITLNLLPARVKDKLITWIIVLMLFVILPIATSWLVEVLT